MFSERNQQLIERLDAERNGYSDYKELPDGRLACIVKFIFTHGIIAGLDEYGYADRWCYHDGTVARGALLDWDGTGEPTGWHRASVGSRGWRTA